MAYTSNSIPSGDWITRTIKQTKVDGATTPFALPAIALTGRRFITVYNGSGAPLYLGDSGVTTTNGLTLPNGSSMSLNLDAGVILYGIQAAAAGDIRVFEGA